MYDARSVLMTAVRFHRVVPPQGRPVPFFVDGSPYLGAEGDTVFIAMLVNGLDFGDRGPGTPARTGFCLMGACQDCQVMLEDGQRVRSCTTKLHDRMSVVRFSRP